MADNRPTRSSNLGRNMRSSAGPAPTSEAGEFALGTQAGAPEAAAGPERVAESEPPAGYRKEDPYLQLAAERRKKEATQRILTGGAAPAGEEPQDISERLRQRQLAYRQLKQQDLQIRAERQQQEARAQSAEQAKKSQALLKPEISDTIIGMLSGASDFLLEISIDISLTIIGLLLWILTGPIILLLQIFILIIRLMQAPVKFKNYLKSIPVSLILGSTAGTAFVNIKNRIDAKLNK